MKANLNFFNSLVEPEVHTGTMPRHSPCTWSFLRTLKNIWYKPAEGQLLQIIRYFKQPMNVQMKLLEQDLYPAALLTWILVFSKSRGWNRRVEQVPLKEPAINDLTTGCYNKRKQRINIPVSSSGIDGWEHVTPVLLQSLRISVLLAQCFAVKVSTSSIYKSSNLFFVFYYMEINQTDVYKTTYAYHMELGRKLNRQNWFTHKLVHVKRLLLLRFCDTHKPNKKNTV